MEIPIHVEWIKSFLVGQLYSFSSQSKLHKKIPPEVFSTLSNYRSILYSSNMNSFCTHELYSLALYAIDPKFDFLSSSFSFIRKFLLKKIPAIDMKVEELESKSSKSFDCFDKLASHIMLYYLIKKVETVEVDSSSFDSVLDIYESYFERWIRENAGNKSDFFRADFFYDIATAQSVSLILAKARSDLIRLDRINYGSAISKEDTLKNWGEIEVALIVLGVRKPNGPELNDKLCLLCFLGDLYVAINPLIPNSNVNNASKVEVKQYDAEPNYNSSTPYSCLQRIDMLLDKINQIANSDSRERNNPPPKPQFKPIQIMSSIEQPIFPMDNTPSLANPSLVKNESPNKMKMAKPYIVTNPEFETELKIIRNEKDKRPQGKVSKSPQNTKSNLKKLPVDDLDNSDSSILNAEMIPKQILKHKKIASNLPNKRLNKDALNKSPTKRSNISELDVPNLKQKKIFEQVKELLTNKTDQESNSINEFRKKSPKKALPVKPQDEYELYSRYQIAEQLKATRQRIVSKPKKQISPEAPPQNKFNNKNYNKNDSRHYKQTKQDMKSRKYSQYYDKNSNYNDYDEDLNSEYDEDIDNSKNNKKKNYHRKDNIRRHEIAYKNNNDSSEIFEDIHPQKRTHQKTAQHDFNQQQSPQKPKKDPGGSYYENYQKRKKLIEANQKKNVVKKPKYDEFLDITEQVSENDKKIRKEKKSPIKLSAPVGFDFSPEKSMNSKKASSSKKSVLNKLIDENEEKDLKEKHEKYKQMVPDLDASNEFLKSDDSNIIPQPIHISDDDNNNSSFKLNSKMDYRLTNSSKSSSVLKNENYQEALNYSSMIDNGFKQESSSLQQFIEIENQMKEDQSSRFSQSQKSAGSKFESHTNTSIEADDDKLSKSNPHSHVSINFSETEPNSIETGQSFHSSKVLNEKDNTKQLKSSEKSNNSTQQSINMDNKSDHEQKNTGTSPPNKKKYRPPDQHKGLARFFENQRKYREMNNSKVEKNDSKLSNKTLSESQKSSLGESREENHTNFSQANSHKKEFVDPLNNFDYIPSLGSSDSDDFDHNPRVSIGKVAVDSSNSNSNTNANSSRSPINSEKDDQFSIDTSKNTNSKNSNDFGHSKSDKISISPHKSESVIRNFLSDSSDSDIDFLLSGEDNDINPLKNDKSHSSLSNSTSISGKVESEQRPSQLNSSMNHDQSAKFHKTRSQISNQNSSSQSNNSLIHGNLKKATNDSKVDQNITINNDSESFSISEMSSIDNEVNNSLQKEKIEQINIDDLIQKEKQETDNEIETIEVENLSFSIQSNSNLANNSQSYKNDNTSNQNESNCLSSSKTKNTIGNNKDSTIHSTQNDNKTAFNTLQTTPSNSSKAISDRSDLSSATMNSSLKNSSSEPNSTNKSSSKLSVSNNKNLITTNTPPNSHSANNSSYSTSAITNQQNNISTPENSIKNDEEESYKTVASNESKSQFGLSNTSSDTIDFSKEPKSPTVIFTKVPIMNVQQSNKTAPLAELNNSSSLLGVSNTPVAATTKLQTSYDENNSSKITSTIPSHTPPTLSISNSKNNESFKNISSQLPSTIKQNAQSTSNSIQTANLSISKDSEKDQSEEKRIKEYSLNQSSGPSEIMIVNLNDDILYQKSIYETTPVKSPDSSKHQDKSLNSDDSIDLSFDSENNKSNPKSNSEKQSLSANQKSSSSNKNSLLDSISKTTSNLAKNALTAAANSKTNSISQSSKETQSTSAKQNSNISKNDSLHISELALNTQNLPPFDTSRNNFSHLSNTNFKESLEPEISEITLNTQNLPPFDESSISINNINLFNSQSIANSNSPKNNQFLSTAGQSLNKNQLPSYNNSTNSIKQDNSHEESFSQNVSLSLNSSNPLNTNSLSIKAESHHETKSSIMNSTNESSKKAMPSEHSNSHSSNSNEASNEKTSLSNNFEPPKLIDSGNIEIKQSPPRNTENKRRSFQSSSSSRESLRVKFDPSFIKPRKSITNPNPPFQLVKQSPPKPQPQLTQEDHELINKYLHDAHEENKSKYQTLSGLEENALVNILPQALRMSTHEIYGAIAQELSIPRNDPIAHRIVSNIAIFFGKDTPDTSPMDKTSKISLPNQETLSNSQAEEEDDDEYF